MSRARMMAGLLAAWPVVAAAQAQFNPDYLNLERTPR